MSNSLSIIVTGGVGFIGSNIIFRVLKQYTGYSIICLVKGHDMRYAIDPTKIHKELGWLPETKFADGIKKTIKWYLENKKMVAGYHQW